MKSAEVAEKKEPHPENRRARHAATRQGVLNC